MLSLTLSYKYKPVGQKHECQVVLMNLYTLNHQRLTFYFFWHDDHPVFLFQISHCETVLRGWYVPELRFSRMILCLTWVWVTGWHSNSSESEPFKYRSDRLGLLMDRRGQVLSHSVSDWKRDAAFVYRSTLFRKYSNRMQSSRGGTHIIYHWFCPFYILYHEAKPPRREIWSAGKNLFLEIEIGA